MIEAFDRYFESDACADIIRGYVKANRWSLSVGEPR